MMKFSLLLVLGFFLFMIFLPEENVTDNQVKEIDITIKENIFLARPDYIQLELIANRPLMILKYSDADKQCLGIEAGANKNWFVAWAQGTDLACPLQRVTAQKASEKLASHVCRGLQDQCRGSIYNLQGKVYQGQLSKQDLLIPDHRVLQRDGHLFVRVKYQ